MNTPRKHAWVVGDKYSGYHIALSEAARDAGYGQIPRATFPRYRMTQDLANAIHATLTRAGVPL